MPLLRDPRLFLLAIVWLATLAAQLRTSLFDALVLGWFYAGAHPALVAVAGFVTALGGWKILVPLTLLGAVALWRRGNKRHALYLLAFTIWGRVVVDLVKLMIGRDRPAELPQLADAFSASFPSGHSANSTIVYGALALLLAPARNWALGLALGLSFLIGVSRLLLGVHWPSDVVGGWTLGLIWTLALHRLVRTNGTAAPRSSLMANEGEQDMSDNDRAQTARRHDDSDLIDGMEDGPAFSGSSGGNLQRDIATRAEQQHEAPGAPGITRVQDKDKPEQANLPRFNESN